ncbi:hypothetical protein B7994_06470 [Fibrobacter sp. UWR2]|nr:hypothetical protein B7994_06470 [Fibrobacter sp. UWR2]
MASLKFVLLLCVLLCAMFPLSFTIALVVFIVKWILRGISLFIQQLVFAEIVFKKVHNGGLAVFIRTVITGSFISLFVLVVHRGLWWDISPWDRIFTLEWWDLDARLELLDEWWKYCGIYAAVYTSYYARFVSQWTYISNLYNQIKNAEISMCIGCDGKTPCTPDVSVVNCNRCAALKLNGWKAGFIEDAETLHMVTKPLFAGVIYSWLTKNDEVAKIYKTHHSETYAASDNPEERLAALIKKLKKSLKIKEAS